MEDFTTPTTLEEIEFCRTEIKKHLQSLSFDIRFQTDLNIEPIKDRMFRDISSLCILFRNLEKLM